MEIKFNKRPNIGDIFVDGGNIYTLVEIAFEEMPYALVNLTTSKITIRSNDINDLCKDWNIEKIIRYKDVLICENIKKID